MTATIELSYYPLNNEYPASVLRFLEKLNAIPDLEVSTNGMSTVIIGDFKYIWSQLGSMLEVHFNQEDAIAVMKVAGGRRDFI
jgi:uncharacterized protein YqgV (UPF0045/DUF77 family)